MDRQETFDRVTRHLLKQGRRSMVVEVGACAATHRYRGRQDMRCAIGCLIPDLLYDELMEGLSVLHPAVYSTFGAGKDDVQFLDGLQRVHDCHGADRWAEMLKVVAWQFDLDESVVEEVQ